METSRRSEHLFIVRLWQEAGQPPGSPWRGSVEHVPSAQRFYFTSLDDLNDFITLRLNSNPRDGESIMQSSSEK